MTFVLQNWTFNEANIRPGFWDQTSCNAPSQSIGRHPGVWEMVGEFQIFLLGYYYTALASIVNIDQLAIKEAFGAWPWYETTMITLF